MRDRRSGGPAQAWEQLDLVPPAPDHRQGVGGRHGPGPDPAGGGGYLNERKGPGLSGREKKTAFRKVERAGGGDPREEALLAELDAMGLSRVLLTVADAIGFDNFMEAWRILDAAGEALADNESGIYLRMPRLAAYKRYQRNRFIEALADLGLSQPEILARVKKDLGEEISARHTRRLMGGKRARIPFYES